MKPHARMVFRNAVSSALGQVSLAGYARNPSRGGFRIFHQYALVCLLDGTGRYRDTNGYDCPLAPGNVIFVFPDLAHSYGPEKGKTWHEYYLCFNGAVFDLWQSSGILNPRQPVFHVEPVSQWRRRFEDVLGVLGSTGFSPPLREVCRLQELIADILLSGASGIDYQSQMKWAARACGFLESDLARDLDVCAVAEKMNMKEESFRKKFTKLIGCPPARFRVTRLIDRACELLQENALTNSQIADALGFCDEFHFSRCFQRVMGLSPRAFRRRFPG